MTLDRNLTGGAYFRDILDQPRALRETIAVLAGSQPLEDFLTGLSIDSYKWIVLTGMGGSFHVLHPLYLRLTELGYPVLMAETSELIHFMQGHLNRDTLLLVVSQSGQSAETVRLLALNRNGPRSAILGVTNDASSPLAKQSDVLAIIQAGPEATVSCKTTTSSLAALAWIGARLGKEDRDSIQAKFEPVAPSVEEYLSKWKTHVEALSAELRGIQHLFVAGRGSSLAATGVGGMLMKEAAHFHSEGMSCAALRHGPFEMLSGNCFAVVFAGDPHVESLNRALVADIRRTGAKAELVSADSELEPLRLPAVCKEARPIFEMLPLQMISLALAKIAGREAGKFERIGKVTATE